MTVPCPRCQASGEDNPVIMQDGYGVCPVCETSWQRGSLGQMVAIDAEE